MAASSCSSPQRRYGDIKARRTEAMPSNSLFGSILERLRPQEEEQLRSMDLARLGELARQYEAPKIRGKPPLRVPSGSMDKQRREVEECQQEVERRMRNLRRREGKIRRMEEVARFDLDHPLDLLPSGEAIRRRHGQWGDLGLVKDLNSVGLGHEGNLHGFNRDKYQPRPPVHRYGLIGDIFRTGMDFDVKSKIGQPVGKSQNEKGDANVEGNKEQQLTNRSPGRQKLRPLPPSTHVIPGSDLEIPANIKHQFGSEVCEAILSDPQKIAASRPKPSTSRPTHQRTPQAAQETKRSSSASYDQLGGTLRSNIFPGLTKDHQESSTHRVHAQEVYNLRDEVPDKFRFQWDHVSRWNEANVRHERMMKGDGHEKGV